MTTGGDAKHRLLAERMGRRVSELPGVLAVACGGSVASGSADHTSDIDLYVFAHRPPPPGARHALALEWDSAPEIDNRAFGIEDAWTDSATGIAIDIIYWTPAWVEEQLTRVIDDHVASTGYSTCFWRTIHRAIPIADPNGTFASLKARASVSYPEGLRRNIVSLNRPLLDGARASFLHQIDTAIERDDAVSVNHRVATWLASYFDIVFATNRVLHPGEKRLLAVAVQECPVLPRDMSLHVADALAASAQPWIDGRLLAALHRLTANLDDFLRARNLTVGSVANP